MKPYSLDLRQKVVETYEAGGISQRQLAKTFRVTASFVQDLLKQKRESGTIALSPHTKHTKTNAQVISTETPLPQAWYRVYQ